MKVAVLADIHGNLPALKAVLADVAASDADLIVLNGDLADGPFPAETLDLMLTLGDRARWVRGNGDRWLVEAHDGRFAHDDPQTRDLITWAASKVTRAHRDMLAALPLTWACEVPGLGRIGFCHATARHDNEMLLVDSSLAHYAAAFAALNAPIVVVGHTHMPFDRLCDGRRIVNAGSVGVPYGHRGASWLMLGPEVVLRRTLHDAEAAARQIRGTQMPGVEAFVRSHVLASPSDREALEAFDAVRRRQQAGGKFS